MGPGAMIAVPFFDEQRTERWLSRARLRDLLTAMLLSLADAEPAPGALWLEGRRQRSRN